ncbi:CGNR zinc finger domain-containing protein [Paenibacillus septentrionalis]|uniref:CGNR zinc finger domain-containing protein n=1 Tax=Paenibacillus septentrionalis TaxID=429342 RepID=A0ABW1V7F8_9BACL
MHIDVKFPLLSGDISIDLINTEVVRHNQRHDLLTEPGHLVAWFHAIKSSGYIEDAQFSAEVEKWAEEALPALRQIRALLRQQFEQLADGQGFEQHTVSVMERLIGLAPFAYQLRNNRLLPVPSGSPKDALLALIAFNLLQLKADDRLQHVHRCDNKECVLLFIDNNPRRKWCSMKICGNRMKVTRHQQQKKHESST